MGEAQHALLLHRRFDRERRKDVKSELARRFLYEADEAAIQVLLTLCDVEESLENIFPSYTPMTTLRKDILSFMHQREDRHLIADGLTRHIHMDLTRFELFVFLEGYRRGRTSQTLINRLEILTFEYLPLVELYGRRNLFHRDRAYPLVEEFREEIFHSIECDGCVYKFLRDVTVRFDRRVLRKKVYNLNAHIGRQIHYDLSYTYPVLTTEEALTFQELKGIDRKLVRFLYLDGLAIYQQAFWDGLNDEVMNRYH